MMRGLHFRFWISLQTTEVEALKNNLQMLLIYRLVKQHL